MPRRLAPQLVTALQDYTRRDVATDLAAGIPSAVHPDLLDEERAAVKRE